MKLQETETKNKKRGNQDINLQQMGCLLMRTSREASKDFHVTMDSIIFFYRF